MSGRFYYSDTITAFLAKNTDEIVGVLAQASMKNEGDCLYIKKGEPDLR